MGLPFSLWFMPVSAARIREFHKQLEMIVRDIGEDEQYTPFLAAVEDALHALDETVDEIGQPRESAPPQVGARVKQAAPEDEPPEGDELDPADAGPPPRKAKSKMPPQFMRGGR